MLALILTILITISDRAERHYITEAEIRTAIAAAADTAHIRATDCEPIEQALRATAMVRTAECYLQTDGSLKVTINQRVPQFHVWNGRSEYWVDSERNRIDVKHGIEVHVPRATGVIGDSLATHGLYDLMTYLQQDAFYRERLERVVVNERQEAVVFLTGGKRALIGRIDAGHRAKLQKLKRLYKKGFEVIGEPSAREFDLRYKGQVIAR